MTTVQNLLASAASLAGAPTEFTPETAPADPLDLFTDWFEAAIAAGVAEPHAMTLSTVDADGLPDARVLILKELSEKGAWTFAGSTDSTKGVQLGARPVAALTFHWKEQIRSVRLRGTVRRAGSGAGQRDFLARGLAARTVALAARQSHPLTDPTGFDGSLTAARRKLEQEPATVPASWTVRELQPEVAEFWQGRTDRRHVRLQYLKSGSGGERRRLQR